MRQLAWNLALVAVSGFIGMVAWESLALLPMVVALPALWTMARGRWAAFALAGAYYLAVSRGLITGTATYFDAGIAYGTAIWLLAGVALAACWGIAWTDNLAQRPLRAFLALLATTVPPVGIVGWASPVVAAGALFPGWHWWGLVAVVALMLAMVWRPWLAGLPVVWLLVSPLTATATPLPDWQGHDSQLEYRGGADLAGAFRRQRHWLDALDDAPAGVHVLPESTTGPWTDTSASLWRSLPSGHRVLMGGTVMAGDKTDNVVIDYQDGEGEVVYRQRMPVPLSMWRPWQDGSTRAHWFANPVIEVGGQTVAPLICYEMFLTWPVLQSVAAGADVLVGMANDWWASQTSIPTIQQTHIAAWGALFSLPVVTAINT